MGGLIDLVDWYTEILKEDPSSEVFVSLAEALCLDEKWGKAVDVCRRGLDVHPGNLRARVLLGLALIEIGDVREGAGELERARRELEKNAVLYMALASVAEQDGDSDRAGRLSDIYAALLDAPVAVSPERESIRQPRTERKPASIGESAPKSAVPEPRADRFMRFLSSWIKKCESRADLVSPPVRLFSEDDRELLRKLLEPNRVLG